MIDHLAFTGSASGMDAEQAIVVIDLLLRLQPKYVHEGGCVGADEQFHKLVDMFFPDVIVQTHPGDVREEMISTYTGALSHEKYPIAQPLDRNHTMIDVSKVLIATPHRGEYQRAGDWSTIRYARTKGIPRFIVYPRGKLVVEGYSLVWGATLESLEFTVAD